MIEDIFSLEALLHPFSKDLFYNRYWEKMPLHIRRGGLNYYRNIFSSDALDYILSSTDISYPNLRLYMPDAQVTPDHFTKRNHAEAEAASVIADVQAIYDMYQQGATIRLLEVARYWKSVKIFCANLEEELHAPIHVDVWFSAPNSIGIPPHYDTIDAFILQIEGSKRWRIWDAPNKLPVREQNLSQKAAAEYAEKTSPVFDVTTEPGDLIYVPRGNIHQVRTLEGSHSLHITMAMRTIRWIDVFFALSDGAIKSLEASGKYEQSIKFERGPYETTLPETYHHLFREMLDSYTEEFTLEKAVQRAQEMFVHSRYARRPGRLSDLNSLESITVKDRVYRCPGIRPLMISQTGNVTLRFSGKEVNLPLRLREALDFILSHTELTVGEIPHLDEAGQLLLVRRLIREGLLSIHRHG